MSRLSAEIRERASGSLQAAENPKQVATGLEGNASTIYRMHNRFQLSNSTRDLQKKLKTSTNNSRPGPFQHRRDLRRQHGTPLGPTVERLVTTPYAANLIPNHQIHTIYRWCTEENDPDSNTRYELEQYPQGQGHSR